MGSPAISTIASAPRAGTVDVLVGLLADVDSSEFYDRVCHALCTLTSMRRAALLLYDPAYRSVIPKGSHGVDPHLVAQIEGTLDETPIAQRALAEDRVVEVSEDHASHVPARYARFAGITTITCTPISAAGRYLGVIFADRGGGRFTLSESERQTMLTLGRLAALTASVERSTEQHEREQRLEERIALTRELHDQAIQRLFGVLMALGSEGQLSDEERARCRDELRSVVGDLRNAVTRPVGAGERETKTSLAELLARLAERRPEVALDWQPQAAVPAELEPLAQAVLAEALRNIDRHSLPERIEVRVGRGEGTFFLEIENDGVGAKRSTRGGGLGLRLAALEALRHEGIVEFGPLADRRWRVRLVVPVAG
jgi:signal transduction histidine kinase